MSADVPSPGKRFCYYQQDGNCAWNKPKNRLRMPILEDHRAVQLAFTKVCQRTFFSTTQSKQACHYALLWIAGHLQCGREAGTEDPESAKGGMTVLSAPLFLVSFLENAG